MCSHSHGCIFFLGELQFSRPLASLVLCINGINGLRAISNSVYRIFLVPCTMFTDHAVLDPTPPCSPSASNDELLLARESQSPNWKVQALYKMTFARHCAVPGVVAV